MAGASTVFLLCRRIFSCYEFCEVVRYSFVVRILIVNAGITNIPSLWNTRWYVTVVTTLNTIIVSNSLENHFMYRNIVCNVYHMHTTRTASTDRLRCDTIYCIDYRRLVAISLRSCLKTSISRSFIQVNNSVYGKTLCVWWRTPATCGGFLCIPVFVQRSDVPGENQLLDEWHPVRTTNSLMFKYARPKPSHWL